MSGIKVEQPLNILEKIRSKGLKVDLKGLCVAGIKGLIRFGFGKPESLAESGVDIATAFDMNPKPGEVAYFLITRSFASAIDTLLSKSLHLLTREPNEQEITNILVERFNSYLENHEIIIDERFYRNPSAFPFVKVLKAELADWLKNSIAGENSDSNVQNIKNRFPAYFISALREEYQSKNYNSLKERLSTPFTLAEERAFGWLNYSAWLQKLVEESIFTESFSLKQIYVDLRAYYQVELEKEGKKQSFDSDADRKKKISENCG